MIIQNYGLHWKRVDIDWGGRGAGNAGSLRGRRVDQAAGDIVDFRNQAGIYILHDRFTPIYIGQVGRGAQRMFLRIRQHTRNHLAERWDRFSWFGVLSVNENGLDEGEADQINTTKSDVLNHLEGILISVTEPALNRQGARMGDARQYRQVPLVEDQEEEDDEEGGE